MSFDIAEESRVPKEESDGWVLPLTGMKIINFVVGYQFRINLNAHGVNASLSVENNYTLSHGTTNREFKYNELADVLESVPRLFEKTVSSCRASNTGVLTMEFTEGGMLRVMPDEEYEAWVLNGPEKVMIVCMPGGELAIWTK